MTNNDMCSWPFVDFILDASPPKMGEMRFALEEEVPPSKGPKPPTPPPEPKETNPWLISPPTPTPNPDGATASLEPGPSQAQGNNPEPAANAAPAAPPPAPPLTQPILLLFCAAFPAIPVNPTEPQGPFIMPNKYWCKELNDVYTLRTREKIATMTGGWALTATAIPYFVRTW